MKPDGRSLDIAVVGLGQAGGNLASELFRRGYRALALNTAKTDLSALDPGGVYPALPADRRLYIGLDGYDGAGKDPSYGRDCITEHADRIRDAILKHTSGADCVIVTAGLGGGTGSAITALTNVLKSDNLPLVALVTLPTEAESGIAKVNAVRAINELVDAPMMGWIFVDNARIATLNQDVSIVEYFSHVNGTIAAPLDALNRLNDRAELKPIRSFDGEDFRKLLLSGGVLNYGVIELPNITVDEIVGAFKDGLEASELMPRGFDPTKTSYLGLVIEAPEGALTDATIAVFEEIDERLKAETEGAAIYQGIYKTTEEKKPPTLRFISANQSLPHRIRELLADAKREGMAIRNKLEEQLPTLELGEIERFELFRPGARNRSDRPRPAHAPAKKLELPDEIVRAAPAKAADPKRRPGPQPAPAARPSKPDLAAAPDHHLNGPRPPKLEAKPRPRAGGTAAAPEVQSALASELKQTAKGGPDIADAETGQIEVGADRMKARPFVPPPATTTDSGAPDPSAYDKLVADYLHADDDGVRKQIADRLEADSEAEETIVRYYAVEAMSKLGREVFGTALLAATEDDSEAVRALAVEALRR